MNGEACKPELTAAKTAESHPLSSIKYCTIFMWPASAAAYSGVHLSYVKENNTGTDTCVVWLC